MKLIFSIGDRKSYSTIVQSSDQATFHGQLVHPVCSTFALAREMEWSSRLFFIDMMEEDEEGVGTFLDIQHRSPAFVGEALIITATIGSIVGNELMCNIEVKSGERIIALGKTGQRMLKKDKLIVIFTPPNEQG
jgi:fluoroacetyl-CoA thioesterase